MNNAKPEFVMPSWMEPYRDMFQNTGGNSIESLMNDRDTNAWNNAVRSALIISVDSQVTLLIRMHAAGLIPAEDTGARWSYSSQQKAWVTPEVPNV